MRKQGNRYGASGKNNVLYSIFCNVDSNQYRTWFGKDYLRQGRRNLDRYRIYRNAVGERNNVSDLFQATEIIDPLRPPVPLLK